MRLTIATLGLMLTASVALAGEVTSTTVAPQVAVATTGQSGAEGTATLSPAPYKQKAKTGYSGCHSSREAQAPLLMY